MGDRKEAVLVLGADRGERQATFAQAEALIGTCCGTVLARSRDHWSEAVGFSDPELFLNRALLVETVLGPEALLDRLLAIEHELGRRRIPGEGPGPRTIDIDIAWLGPGTHAGPHPVLPHPRLHRRAFMLGPAADLAPHWRHPLLGRTVLELLDHLRHSA